MEEINRLHDIADDIASTSWGYELADALHRIAADIGEKVDGMRRVGEYEDDVLTWVEAYGGLEEVKKELSRFIDRSGYESDVLGWVEKNGGLYAVKERLMPEGMSWPRFEDGEPVRIGDHWQEDDYDESITRVDSIEFAEDGVRFENEYADTFYRYGERVKRPAPKVLDADGVEIHVGDTVWHTKTGAEYRVLSLPDLDRGAWVTTKTNTADRLFLDLAVLTHRAPVLAADGKPLREGETVWDTKGNGPYTVERFDTCDRVYIAGREYCYLGGDFTHERPDSWERWVEDTDKSPCEYFGVTGSGCDGCRRDPYMCSNERNEDLVRRAKKLPKGCE